MASFNTEQNALSTTAELIVAANNGRTMAEIKNADAAISIYLGSSSSVSTSNGHLLKAGESFVFQDYDGPIYAIAASGTPTVTILEY
jgi:hypothetical protein